MKKPENPYSIMAIGGSNVTGQYVGEDNTYVNQLMKQTGYNCLTKIGTADLKHSTENIQAQIDKFNPDIILLQSDEVETNNQLLPGGKITESLLSFFIFQSWLIFGKRKNMAFLRSIKKITENNPKKYFIVISPIPCNNKYNNKIRLTKGKLMKKIFSTSTNVTYINLLNSVVKEEKYYSKNFQLNKTGHTVLAKLIARKTGLNYFYSPGNFAA